MYDYSTEGRPVRWEVLGDNRLGQLTSYMVDARSASEAVSNLREAYPEIKPRFVASAPRMRINPYALHRATKHSRFVAVTEVPSPQFKLSDDYVRL